MKYSKIYQYCSENGIDTREVLENLYNEEDDFTVDECRFISDGSIDGIQQDELSSDTYVLGCFNSWFIADILGCPMDAIKSIQDKDGFDGLGKILLPHIEEVQSKYSAMDGYGHHFNRYDGTEENMCGYYIFNERG